MCIFAPVLWTKSCLHDSQPLDQESVSAFILDIEIWKISPNERMTDRQTLVCMLYACMRLTADMWLHIRRWVYCFQFIFVSGFSRARCQMIEDMSPAFLVSVEH